MEVYNISCVCGNQIHDIVGAESEDDQIEFTFLCQRCKYKQKIKFVQYNPFEHDKYDDD